MNMSLDDDSPQSRPAFLSKETAEAIGYIGDPDESPLFDNELSPLPELDKDLEPRGKGPSRGYEIRWREIARLHAHGYTNNQIGKHLGYSPTGISLALQKPFVMEEIERCRANYYSQDTINVIKEGSLDAAKRIHRMVLDPSTKESTALDASKWLVEKATGKAKQEISVDSGTLTGFYDLLKQMQTRNETLDVTPLRQLTIDVAPSMDSKDSSMPDDWDDWIAQNVK